MEQKSHGHFYEASNYQGDFWFEFERDALMFTMKWSSIRTNKFVIDIETTYPQPINHIEFSVVIKNAVS